MPGLVEQHAMIDAPSHVLFPWLHGISDDGRKGQDMAAFFGYECYQTHCDVLIPDTRHHLSRPAIEA